MLRTLHSSANDTTAVANKDHCHLGTACIKTAENVVQLSKERDWLDRVKVANSSMHLDKTVPKVVFSIQGSKCSKHV